MNSKAAEKLKTWLLGGDPAAKEEYLAFRARGGGKLAGGCRLLGRKLRGRPPQEKLLYSGGPESSLSRRESPEQLAARLAAYDVVTFDVFDTLLLRPLDRPEDAFYLLGARLGYPDLRRLRVQAEEEARRRKELATGSREVILEEIWAVLAPETGLSPEEGMAAERKLESDLCRANPYFLPVVAALRRQGKTLAVLSDMYLEEEAVAALLDRCGFGTFAACHVSGERGCSKSGGGLYRLAQKLLGPGRACAHVGDDPWADQRQAEAAGWAAFPYRNVHRAGAPYRTEDMSPIVGSLYRGLVNTRLHNGTELHSWAWEYGYVYGGLFAVGYCRFVERFRRELGADRLLFLSRDGAVLLRVYQRLYPAEGERAVYARWSRLAAAKITADRFRGEYFRRFLTHKAGQGFSLRQVLESMELAPLLPGLCGALGAGPGGELTHKNAPLVKSYLVEHWDQVLACYEGHRQAGGAYYRALLAGCRKALAVDIGWAGSGAVMLDWAVNRLWGLGCPVFGAVAGANSRHSPEWDAMEPFWLTGRVRSYLYSSGENRDLWQSHDPGAGHNLFWELLLGAPEGNLTGFGPKGPILGPPPPHSETIRAIHQGILDFTGDFLALEARLGLTLPISGRDAYAPMALVCAGNNREFRRGWEGFLDGAHIG